MKLKDIITEAYPFTQRITDSVGSTIDAPRVFYRGIRDNGERSIMGTPEWDNVLFASSNKEDAEMYGDNVYELTADPYARIVYEGTAEFKSLMKGFGHWRSFSNKLSLADWAEEAVKRARESNYDAVWFKMQSSVGTAIINKNAFDISKLPFSTTAKEDLL